MEEQLYSTKKGIITALILFFIDALLLNQGLISIIAILIIIIWWLPKAATKKYKKQVYKTELIKTLIYGCMAVAVFTSNYLNNQIAAEQAKEIIPVIEAYHAKTGVYPKNLEDLVPSYLPKIPKAKYTLLSSEFSYINLEGNAIIFYTAIPPFGRPAYSFNRKEWTYLD